MLAPRPYQIVGRDFLAQRTRALLADEMRVGKTPQAILAAEHIGAERVTVVCPAIAVPHWYREWGKWAPESEVDLEVVSYDRARLNSEQLLNKTRDVLIVDECHFAKNPTAKRTKLIYGRDGLGYTAGRIWALSGTPAPRHAGELWPMLRAFGVTYQSYNDFIRRYCTGYWDKQRFEWCITGLNKERLPELRELLIPITLRRRRKDVAPDLPGIDFQFLTVDGEGPELDEPDFTLDEALLQWLERHSAANRDDRIDVAMVKVMPLVEEITLALTNNLIPRTVVFGWHVEPLHRLWDELDARGFRVAVMTGKTPQREREVIQTDFHAGRLHVVIANILAAGTAIDLSAASHGYFLEMDWVPGNNLQAASRLVSMEKKEPISFDVVTLPGSVDDRVQSALVRRVRELSQLM